MRFFSQINFFIFGNGRRKERRGEWGGGEGGSGDGGDVEQQMDMSCLEFLVVVAWRRATDSNDGVD